LPAGATISNPTASVPVITFNSANTYTVILVASNTGGTVTAQQVVNVITCQAPTATFTLPANGCTNFTFAATNSSAGSPAPATLWSISPSVNTTVTPSAISNSPVFRTSTTGVYTITLLTSNASGTATATQTINVTACPPTASFSIPATIRFCDVKTFSTTNQTTNPPGTSGTISYTWNVSPNVGLSFFPNRFQQNMSVTISDPTILGYTVTLLARNASGTLTTAQSIVVDDCTTSINENTLGNALDIYPNPARDIVTIAVPAGETYSVKVTNLLGAVVYSETINKEKASINLATIARGVYFITVESKTEKATRKVILD
jgi:PKD repeat protein